MAGQQAGALDWYLVSNCGTNIELPQTMISFGREACDVILQSKSVDKRHAVITYDHYEKRFKVKDLNSMNGTYLNNARIPSHTFVKVEQLDWLRFGFVVYQVQALERFPTANNATVLVAPVDFRRVVGWPTLTRAAAAVSVHPKQIAPQPPSRMADCHGCQQKQNIRHTCEMKDREWIDSNRPHQRFEQQQQPLPVTTGQDYCGNIMTSHAAPVVALAGISPTVSAAATAVPRQPTPHDAAREHSGLDATQSQHSCHCAVSGCSPSRVAFAPQDALSPLGGAGIIYRSPETSSNSLKSNFSGDSLDIMCDPSASSALAKKQLLAGSPLNVVKSGMDPATQPSSSSSSMSIRSESNAQDMRAPSFCPPSAPTKSDSKDSSLTVGGERVASVRPPSCTAFTIEFDGDGSAATKKLDIKDSIRKFAPPKSELELSKSMGGCNGSSSSGSAGHRRNLSLSKAEEIKVIECFSDENGNTDEKSSELSPTADENKKRGGEGTSVALGSDLPSGHSGGQPARLWLGGHHVGYMSEGHFSSDQDDDMSARSDPIRNGSAKGVYSGVSKLSGEPERPPRRVNSAGVGSQFRHSMPATDLKDSARYLISKMFGETASPNTEGQSKNIKSDSAVVGVRLKDTEIVEEAVETISPLLTKNDHKTGSHSSLTSTATYVVQGDAATAAAAAKSRVPFKTDERLDAIVRGLNSSSDEEKEPEVEDRDDGDNEEVENDEDATSANVTDGEDDRIREDVSESGTYTIEKDADDVDPKDEVEARKNIDKVFGVEHGHSIAANPIIQRPVVNEKRPEEDDVNVFEGVVLRIKSPASESEAKAKNENNSRKTTPRWLKEWVAQSAGQVITSIPPEAAICEPSKSSTQGASSVQAHSNRSVMTPSNSGGISDLPPQRPRRKLPVLPVAEAPSNKSRPLTMRAATLFSPPERLRAHSMSPDGIRSDSSMDTETILKDTENVVSAMEARMIDHQRDNGRRETRKKILPVIAISSQESRDSGGESDLDTSAASPVQDRNFRVPVQPTGGGIYKKLSAQLKAQLRGLDGQTNAAKIAHGDYNGDNLSEVETASIHSDVSTSSDMSGSSPGSKRKTDGSPVMRFNRAFSLRRARLGCESDGGGGGGGSSVGRSTLNSKRLSTPVSSSRPNSAGSASANKDRRIPSAKKNDIIGPPTAPSSVIKPGSFARNDGGRFSLRLPRSAPLSTRTQLAAAKVPHPPASASTPYKNQVLIPKAPPKNLKAPSNPRSNSTLTSKELELKNWRRRKEYDPLKAAAEGRKKEAAARKVMVSPAVSAKSESASPTGMSFQRSASFHGTDGLIDGHTRHDTFTCDDDDDDDGEDESLEYNGKSHGLDKLVTAAFENSDSIYRSRNKKNSEDDSASEATRTMSHTELASDDPNTSPRGTPIMHPALRHKNKTDALDNLVISTIHQLSSNLRGTTVNILRKVGEMHRPECEQVFGKCGLEDSIAKLGNDESPVSSPQGRTVSKQLSAILKNVKRLEDSLHFIDKVLHLVPVVSAEENGHDNVNGSGHRDRKSPSRSKHNNKWNGFQGYVLQPGAACVKFESDVKVT